MHDESRLDELLLCWEDSQHGPKPLTVDQLCCDCPELRDLLLQHITQLQWINRVLGSEEQAVPALDVGCLIGRYRLEQYLGAGGFGQVWKAYDPELDRCVALKLLHPYRVATAARLNSVLTEARNLARLQHPNIVTIYDAGRDEGSVYLVTELVDGQTFQSRIEAASIDHHQAVSIVQDIGQALQHAHNAGIVHRDVKPANILVDGQGRAHLTDFGIAFSAGQDNSPQGVFGTPGYMAPEQAGKSDQPVGPACDIYSLGKVLIAALVGPSRMREALPVGVEVSGPLLAELGVPEKLREVCVKATATNPVQRFASMTEFLAGLDDATAPAGRVPLRSLLGVIGLAVALLTVSAWNYYIRSQSTGIRPVGEQNAATKLQQFEHNFDMFGDYQENLVSARNAKVYTEPDGVTRYWCPSASQVEGEVIYGYDLGFAIQSASLSVRLEAHGPNSLTYLYASRDMVTWIPLATNDIPDFPAFDLTPIVKDSRTAYVRVTLCASDDVLHYAQFLRTNPMLHAPSVYSFRATGVAESAATSQASR